MGTMAETAKRRNTLARVGALEVVRGRETVGAVLVVAAQKFNRGPYVRMALEDPSRAAVVLALRLHEIRPLRPKGAFWPEALNALKALEKAGPLSEGERKALRFIAFEGVFGLVLGLREAMQAVCLGPGYGPGLRPWGLHSLHRRKPQALPAPAPLALPWVSCSWGGSRRGGGRGVEEKSSGQEGSRWALSPSPGGTGGCGTPRRPGPGWGGP